MEHQVPVGHARRKNKAPAAGPAGIFDLLEEGVLILDRNLRLTYVNAAGAALLQGKPEELRGRTIFDAAPAAWCPEVGNRLKEAVEGHEAADFVIHCAVPGELWLQCRCMPAGNGIAMTLQDITQWKRAEEYRSEEQRRMQLRMDELESIYSSAPIGLCVLDTDLRYVRINDVLARVNGRPASEHIGRTVREMVPGLTDRMEALVRSIVDSGRPALNVEFSGFRDREDTAQLTLVSHWHPLKDGEGRVIGINVVVEDITARKRAEEALKASEANYRSIFDSASDAIFVHDADTGAILDVNRAASEMYGYPPGEMRGLTVAQISSGEYPYTQEEAVSRIRSIFLENRQSMFEWKAKNKSGRQFWVEVSLVQTAINNHPRIIAMVRDITERKRLEEALKESEERFRLIAESMPQLVWTTDRNGNADYYNQHYREYSGVDPFDPEAPNPMHPDDVRKTREAWERSVRTGEEYRVEHRVRRRDGVYRWHLSRGRPVRDASGAIVKWYGTATDIEDQKRAQETLKEAAAVLEEKVRARTRQLDLSNRMLEGQKEMLQKIIDHIPVMIILMDPSGKIGMVNREFEKATGWNLEDAQSRDIIGHDFPDPVQRREFLDFIGRDNAGWRDFEPVNRWGERLPSSWANIRLSDGSRIGIGIDISSRKKMEQNILRQATAIEHAGEGVVVLDPQWVIEYVNPAFEHICGYSRDELIGWKVDCVRDSFLDEDGWKHFNEELSQGRTWSSHQRRRRKDGQVIEATLTVSSVRDEADRIINYVCMVRDVTSEVRLQQQMAQTQKLEAIGTLAGGIAHDLKNIFTPIVLNSEVALEDLGKDSPVYPVIEETLRAAKLGADLTRQIVTFSRRTKMEKRPVDISLVTGEALAFLRSTLPATIELRQDIEHHAPRVLADATQIKQVLINLGNNAGYAMREQGGTLEVSLSSLDVDEQTAAKASLQLAAGRYVCIMVRDTGVGMDEKTLEHIFEPFYTTKQAGEGTGMGLAVVHGIVKDHGGAVLVRSRKGQGSTFRVYLPALRENQAG